MHLHPRDAQPFHPVARWVGPVLVAVMVAGLVAATAGAWRPGLLVVGGALLAAAGLRTTVPAELLGTLALRTRWIDVTWMLSVAAVLLVAALALP